MGFRELYDQKEEGRYPFSAQEDFFPFSFFFFLFAFLFYMFDMISRFLFSVQASRAWRFGWGIIRCVNKAFLLFSRLPKMSCKVG